MKDAETQTDIDATTQTNGLESINIPLSTRNDESQANQVLVNKTEIASKDYIFELLGSEDFAIYIAKIVSTTQVKSNKIMEQKLKEVAREYRENHTSKEQATKDTGGKRKTPDDYNEKKLSSSSSTSLSSLASPLPAIAKKKKNNNQNGSTRN